MGDKRINKSLDTLAVDIKTKGWSKPLLRDEIYISFVKKPLEMKESKWQLPRTHKI